MCSLSHLGASILTVEDQKVRACAEQGVINDTNSLERVEIPIHGLVRRTCASPLTSFKLTQNILLLVCVKRFQLLWTEGLSAPGRSGSPQVVVKVDQRR